jgi:4-amino-4-deoxy-L-arabinose transferase-like glycosyltransferase
MNRVASDLNWLAFGRNGEGIISTKIIPIKDSKRGVRVRIWAILLFALMLRIGYVMTLDYPHQWVHDEYDYHICANNLLAGNGFLVKYKRAHVAPLYPLFLAALYKTGAEDIRAVRTAQALLGVLTCFAVIVLANLIGGARSALIAGILAAVHPYFIYQSGLLLTENLAMLWTPLIILFFLKAFQTGRLISGALFGMFSGLAALTRSVYLMLPLGLIIIAIIVGFKNKRQLLCSMRASCVGVVFLIVAIAPWIVRNWLLFDRLMPITTGSGITMLQQAMRAAGYEGDEYREKLDYYLRTYFNGRRTPLEEVAADDEMRNIAKRMILANPGGYAGNFGANLVKYWSPAPTMIGKNGEGKIDWKLALIGGAVSIPIFTLCVYGLYRLLREKRTLSGMAIMVTMVYFTIIYSMFFALIRYRLPIEPLIVVSAAIGLERLWAKRG